MKTNGPLQTEDDEEKPAFVSDSRTVNLAGGVPADKTAGFAPNNIKTAKYNLITFLPIFLFEMFSRAAYLYFLAQVRFCCTTLHCGTLFLLRHIALPALCLPSHTWPTYTRPNWHTCVFIPAHAWRTSCTRVANGACSPHTLCCAGLPVLVECCLSLLRLWVHSSFGICADCGGCQGHL